jgi:hypothetical protein
VGEGDAWIVAAIEQRLTDALGGPDGLELIVANWQGTLTVWSFTRPGPIQAVVRRSLETLLGRLLTTPRPTPGNGPRRAGDDRPQHPR